MAYSTPREGNEESIGLLDTDPESGHYGQTTHSNDDDLEACSHKHEHSESYFQRPWNPIFQLDPLNKTISSLSRFRRLFFILLRLRHLMFLALPSFVQSRWRNDGHEPRLPHKVSSTDWLNGMRGMAASAVAFYHLSYVVFPTPPGWGEGLQGGWTNPLRLPIIKLAYTGGPMVSMFFILSGYCISLKALKQMRSKKHADLMLTFSSAIFRRGFRLFLPCVVSTFLVFIAIQLQLFEATKPYFANRNWFRGQGEEHPIYLPFWTQLVDWAVNIFDFIHLWQWKDGGGAIYLDRHLWTIPIEYRMSLVLFVTQIALARARPAIRMGIQFLLCWRAHYWDRWDMILFYTGSILAELNLSDFSNVYNFTFTPEYIQWAKQHQSFTNRLWTLFWWLNFICGLFLMSYPEAHADLTPGYIWLESLAPDHHFIVKNRYWISVGCVQAAWAVSNSDSLKNLFTSRVVLYLGEISFSLYVMHGLVTHTFGYWMLATTWQITGWETPFQHGLGFAIAAVPIVFVAIWTADIFWRAVDLPCTKLGRYIDQVLSS